MKTLQILLNWVNLGLIFHSSAHVGLQKKSHVVPSYNYNKVYCHVCKRRYYVKDASFRILKRYYKLLNGFEKCIQHTGYDQVTKQIKKSDEYIKLVNKLYASGFSGDYRKIMKHIDNELKTNNINNILERQEGNEQRNKEIQR